MSDFLAALLRNTRDLPGEVGRWCGLSKDASTKPDSPPRNRISFFDHLHARRVTERALHPAVTMGLGVATITLLFLLTVTGILLMVYYVPTTQDAYASMQDIQYAVAFGGFIRALHRWSAHAMAATAALHLVRVAAMSAYRRREINWLFGLGLLVLTLGLAFTGYLLPWDQLSYWAVNVASSMLDHVPLGGWLKAIMLGGQQVGQPTLTRFYMLHVALLPLALLLLLALHLWRVRQDGGLATSETSLPTVPAWPHLLMRELALALAIITVFCVLSMVFNAPLGALPDPHAPSNPEKAPWYFLWVQEMVSYSAPVGGFWFPGILFGGLVLWPFLDHEDQGVGHWLASPVCRRAVLASLVISLLALVFFESLYLAGQSMPASTLQRDLLNPATGMLLLAMVMFFSVGFWTGSVKAAFMSSFCVLAVAVVGFTLIGVCRGPNWIFYWPWERWPVVS